LGTICLLVYESEQNIDPLIGYSILKETTSLDKNSKSQVSTDSQKYQFEALGFAKL